jgi:putative methyltransferase (TIGR04325 family)
MTDSQSQSIANKLYSNYDEALRLCNGCGYSQQDLTEVVVKKNIAFRKSITHDCYFNGDANRTLLAISFALNLNSLRVIDFGGGGGYHYTLAKHVLSDKCDIKWNIVETDSMCLSGAVIADKSLKFFNEIDIAVADLGNIDLVLTSSALQYCPDPLAYLKKLLSVSAKYVYITRTPFYSGTEKIISIQSSMLSHNGPGTLPIGYEDREILYPISFIPLDQVEKAIQEKYTVRFKVLEDSANLFIDGTPVNSYYGFFCELK